MFLIFTFVSLEIHTRLKSKSPWHPKQSPSWALGWGRPLPRPTRPSTVCTCQPLSTPIHPRCLRARRTGTCVHPDGACAEHSRGPCRPTAALPGDQRGWLASQSAFYHPAPQRPSPGTEGRDDPPPNLPPP